MNRSQCIRSVLFSFGALLVCGIASAADFAAPGRATEWGRTLERLLIVVTGTMSMYCGYRLFAVVSGQAGELAAKAGDWQLRLVRVGPGVFFALFGAAIVIHAMSQAPSVSFDPATGAVREVRGALPGEPVGSPDQSQRAISAIVWLRKLHESGTTSLGAADLTNLGVVARDLEPLQARLVDSAVGPGSYATWQRLTELQHLPGTAYSDAMQDAETRERFEAVDQRLASPVVH